LFGKTFVRRGFNIRFGVAFTERLNNAFAAEKLAFLAPLKTISKNRVLEIDILRSVAILLIVLYHVPSLYIFETSPNSSIFLNFAELIGFIGISLFFFISGFSLYLSNKTIRNRRDVLRFYKKRALRIYPLYWVFVGVILISYRPPFSETLIYVAGLQALFYPTVISNPIYHFISVILIFYLTFPLIVFFKGYKKMLIASLIPLLILITIKLYGQSDSLFLGYYGLFVGGILARELDVYHKMQQVTFRGFLVITLPLFVALASLYLIYLQRYFALYGLGLRLLLENFCGILIALILLFWAVCYVKIYRTRFFAFFTFVAFSTYGAFFLNTPFFLWLSATLIRFHIPGTAKAIIFIVSIPVIVVAGYLLQFITNEIINVLKSSQK
jgi:peptidoglycan/LPS O-acetylase OafA/YrhL